MLQTAGAKYCRDVYAWSAITTNSAASVKEEIAVSSSPKRSGIKTTRRVDAKIASPSAAPNAERIKPKINMDAAAGRKVTIPGFVTIVKESVVPSAARKSVSTSLLRKLGSAVMTPTENAKLAPTLASAQDIGLAFRTIVGSSYR